jgi:peroxiredoxin
LLITWQGKENPGTTIARLVSGLTGNQLLVGVVGILFVVALLIAGWLFLHLLRQHGRLILRLDNLELRLARAGLPPEEDSSQSVAGLLIGSPAPTMKLPLLSGGSLTLATLLQRDKPILLFFSDPDCGPCNALLPAIANWEREYANALTIAVVSRGTIEANRAKAGAYDLAFVVLQQDRETAETFKAPATPSAVVIQADGTIGSQVAMGAQAINELVARVTGTRASGALVLHQGSDNHQHGVPAPAKKSRIGELAPSFRLADLDGRKVELSDFKGRDTLVSAIACCLI